MPSSSSRRGVLIAISALAALALSSAPAAARAAGRPRAALSSAAAGRRSADPLTELSALESLRNYTFIYSSYNGVGTFHATAAVHDPTDWRLTGEGLTTIYDVGGHGYAVIEGFPKVQHVSFKTIYGYNHLNGERAWAAALLNATRAAHIRVSHGGRCGVRGMPGTLYTIRSPSVEKHMLAIVDQACIANRTGALLSYAADINGVYPKALHINDARLFFKVTSVGRVGVIRAPR
jgi:hypothetical protein